MLEQMNRPVKPEKKSCCAKGLNGGKFLSSMKTAGRFSLVLVTAPDLKTARKLARAALHARLIACANLIPKLKSHYRWQGKIESAAEVLLLMKTTRANIAALEELILSKHPYDTPEFLVLPLNAGNARYLKWMSGCVERRRTGR